MRYPAADDDRVVLAVTEPARQMFWDAVECAAPRALARLLDATVFPEVGGRSVSIARLLSTTRRCGGVYNV